MYYISTVMDLPPPECRILQKSAKCTYVYYYTNMHWDANKKRTVDNREAVGKLTDDGEHMYPNERWLEIQSIVSTNKHDTAKYRNVGLYLALYKSSSKIGCIDALKSSFPKIWDKIFALCLYIIDDQNASAQLFPYWGYHNYCGFSKPFSDTIISETYKLISENDWARDEFMSKFQEAYFKNIPHAKEIAVALDGTNRLNRCENNKYCEYGHAKVKGKGLPQVNTCIIVDEATGIPLYYEEYYGSILDMIETPATMERVRSLGFPKMVFAVDSGYASVDCIEAFEDGFEFTVMTPQSFKVYKEAVLKNGKNVRQEKYYIPSEDIYGLCENDIECFNGKYNLFLYYDSNRAKEEIDSIHQKAQTLLQLANQRKFYTEKFAEKFSPHVIITKIPKDPITKKTYKAELNHDEIQKEIDNAGLFVVISNTMFSPEKIIRIQRLRDKDEKCFSRFKSFFGMLASGTHSTATYEGKNFMGFIALIIIESFRWYVKDLLKGSRTTETLIGELRKLQCWKNKEGIGKFATGLTKNQKDIFDHLGMDDNELNNAVIKLIM